MDYSVNFESVSHAVRTLGDFISFTFQNNLRKRFWSNIVKLGNSKPVNVF